MRKTTTLALLLAAGLTAACNTIAGAGRDVASVGNAVSRTADKAK
jgi:predicted small secreted protein